MSQILVDFDPTLTQSDIVVRLTTPGPDQAGDQGDKDNRSGIQQTSVYGILTPLLAINNKVIRFEDIIGLTLDGTGKTPVLTATVRDDNHIIASIDTPTSDNEIRLQILPPFDNAYRKINLTFYASDLKINGDTVSVTGIYKVPSLISDNIKSFGRTDTFSLFRTIAKETGVGFATNVTDDGSDERYIYCDNRSYLSLMDKQIQYSSPLPTKIYDWWIDYWNILNYVDIYERFNATDSQSDMQVWIAGNKHEATEGIVVDPYQTVATLSNHPSMSGSELGVMKYSIINDGSSNARRGTDKVISIYNDDEWMDHLIQDSGVKNDIFMKYSYAGEDYGGGYDYLLASACRETYLQTMNKEVIDITLSSPTLGLMRGKQVLFNWYINDDRYRALSDELDEAGMTDPLMKTNVDTDPVDENGSDGENPNGTFVVDKNISGQYLIIGSKIMYRSGQWSNVLRLTRPSAVKPTKLQPSGR